jgi:hypothetical protein
MNINVKIIRRKIDLLDLFRELENVPKTSQVLPNWYNSLHSTKNAMKVSPNGSLTTQGESPSPPPLTNPQNNASGDSRAKPPTLGTELDPKLGELTEIA